MFVGRPCFFDPRKRTVVAALSFATRPQQLRKSLEPAEAAILIIRLRRRTDINVHLRHLACFQWTARLLKSIPVF
jgi:hypothetical protein